MTQFQSNPNFLKVIFSPNWKYLEVIPRKQDLLLGKYFWSFMLGEWLYVEVWWRRHNTHTGNHHFYGRLHTDLNHGRDLAPQIRKSLTLTLTSHHEKSRCFFLNFKGSGSPGIAPTLLRAVVSLEVKKHSSIPEWVFYTRPSRGTNTASMFGPMPPETITLSHHSKKWWWNPRINCL